MINGMVFDMGPFLREEAGYFVSLRLGRWPIWSCKSTPSCHILLELTMTIMTSIVAIA